MKNKKGLGALFRVMEGKGFYIVLFLCATAVGASSWILLNDAGTDVEENETAEKYVDVSEATVTMVPAGTPMELEDEEVFLPEEEPEEYEEAQSVFSENTGYVWPVRGIVEVPYTVETLRYDSTMADWRIHDGIDIACAIGDQVLAAAGGTVTCVEADPLYGTTVEIDHENGVCSVYSNLAEEPPVWEGQTVTMGQVIGSVGGTAIAETNAAPHLHLSMTQDGQSADPMQFLPENSIRE